MVMSKTTSQSLTSKDLTSKDPAAPNIASLIDQTMLLSHVTEIELHSFIERSLAFPFAAIIVPPASVSLAARIIAATGGDAAPKVGAVVGFPLGYSITETKVFEATRAIDDGASEIDFVINVSRFKSEGRAAVSDEVSAMRGAVPEGVLKVIIECCHLTPDEMRSACAAAIDEGADFVKTSTGFGPGGAKTEDVALLKDEATGRIKVKASGGIRTLDDALSMIEAGADRIGTSAGIEIMSEFEASQGPRDGR